MFNYGYKNFSLEDIKEEYDLIGYVQNENNEINNLEVETIPKEVTDTNKVFGLTKTNFVSRKTIVCMVLTVCIIIVGIVCFKTKKKVYRGKKSYSKLYHFKYDI